MHTIFIMLTILFLSGCILGKRIAKSNFIDGWNVKYFLLYNNRQASHVPVKIVTVAFLKKTQSQFMYEFLLSSDSVTKFSYPYKKPDGTFYQLVFDSNQVGATSNKNLIALSKLDSNIFDKVIYLADSLHFKSFNYLRKEVAFMLLDKK